MLSVCKTQPTLKLTKRKKYQELLASIFEWRSCLNSPCVLHQKNHPPLLSRIHPRATERVRHTNICQRDPYINKLKKTNYLINSLDAEKALYKIQHPFMIKVMERVGMQETYIDIIKAIFCKQAVNIKLNGEKLKAIPLKLVMRQGCPLSPHLFSMSTCGSS